MASATLDTASTPYISIGELVDTSKDQYDQGLILDKGYYKSRIPQSRHHEHITKEQLNQAFYLEAFIDLAKRITTIAVVIIPSIAIVSATFGISAWVPGVLGGGLAALMSEASNKSAKRNPTAFEAISLKANLLACMNNQEKIKYAIREIFIQGVMKAAVYGLIALNVFSTSGFIASASLFFFGYSYGQELLDFATAGLESYFNRYRRHEIEQQAEELAAF